VRPLRHEIPTHLNVEDKLLLGLTMRQFLYVLVGSSMAYNLWEQTVDLLSPLHVGLPAICALAALAMALLRPCGRPLEEWLLAGALYVGRPRHSSWRIGDPDPADWRPANFAWQELAPDLVWIDAEHVT
jgi:PrgI family protein